MRRALHIGRSVAMMVAHRALDAAIAVIAVEARVTEGARRVALALVVDRSRRSAGGVVSRRSPSHAMVVRPHVPDVLSASHAWPASHVHAAPLDLALLDVSELLADVRFDLGCLCDADALALRHRACRAIALLGAFPLDRETIATLEETVTAPRRPACVQRAAIDALSADRSEVARRALSRMLNTARVRAEWSADRDAIAIAKHIDQATSA